jgi:hypothetical protein
MLAASGTYRVTGLVRLEAPLVEINGIANPQRITWSGPDSADQPVARFVSYERLDGPDARPDVQVVGGTLESLSVVPYDLFA